VPSPDPAHYAQPHASDNEAYNEMDAMIAAHQMKPLPFPVVAGTKEPVLRLADALGANGKAAVQAIQAGGEIVFQAAGDTGATRGPATENLVMHKLLADFHGERPAAIPQFFYHLGDIVYSFGEHKYYYDQFYEAFRDYPRPVFAIPGNHDGLVLPPPNGTSAPTLDAFLANFCASAAAHGTDAMGIARTTMTQPGVYFTLEAPYVRILGLYSNMLENPGVVSSTGGRFPDVPDAQLDYLQAALTRVKRQGFEGAVLLAVHHPPYTFGTHSGSLVMLKEIDAVCRKVGVWPHAILSGHAHNYQRFTREVDGRQIPHVVCGNGGHGLQPIDRGHGTTLRTPSRMPAFEQPEAKDKVTFESYDDRNYGYLRVLANDKQLRIEYHPAPDGSHAKTPDDAVTVDLKRGKLAHYVPPPAARA
jgi:hypothetical protein